MNILITGATGFVGRSIVESFTGKYTLLTPSHNELDLLNQKDVQDYFRNHTIDTVIHCALSGCNRKTETYPSQILEKNLRMFFNLAENRDCYSRLINLGSGGEYNKFRDLYNVKEEEFGKQFPPDDYGLSKFIISNYIEKTKNMYCLRPFGLFGKYEDYEFRFISNTIVKNLLHLPIVIQQNVRFSWLYINDFLKILDRFITVEQPNHSDYNVTPDQTTDLLTIAQTINCLSTHPSKIHIEHDGLNYEYSGDNTRLKEFMGGMSFTSMVTAILQMKNYYTSILPLINKDAIRNDVYAKKCVIREGRPDA